MGVNAYQEEVSPGVFRTMYKVSAEALNKYTGLRIQRCRKAIPSLTKAERVYRELWTVCREARPDGLDITHSGQLLDHYEQHLYEKTRSPRNPMGFSPHVVRSKRCRLKHTEAWRGIHLDLITPQFVMDRLDEMEAGGTSRITTNHVLKEIKCSFSHGMNIGVIKVNLFAGMKMRKTVKRRKEALTHEEANRLLSEAKLRSHPYYHVWLLTLALGLRRSELAGLKWIDIDFPQGLIYVRRQKIPGEGVVDFLKDREERIVAIPDNIIPVLREMKLQASTEFVIEVKCHMWRMGGQAAVLREFCRVIGIKEVTHHQLRATHITLALIDGVPLGIVKENVGHAKLSTTDLYFRSAGINMRGQMDGLRIRVPNEEPGVVLPLKASK